MERFIMKKLVSWKESKNRKPLILKGARQVGKTYILMEFGKLNYENIAYFNFDHDEGLCSLFEYTKDPNKIIDKLILASGGKINPNTTLIIFDEIQECTNALNSLKYFCEETPEYHIACAGSLLGIRLSKTSFPVGKVDFLNLNPMSFSEFLIADGSSNLVEYLSSIKGVQPIDEIFATELKEKLKTYYIVGGMPEAVKAWTEDKDIAQVNYILDNILESYEEDFSKHTTANEANKISQIWNNIPSQLAKENKKYIYQVIKPGARAREYENALNWLDKASLISKVYNVTKPSFPLKAYHDLSSFKVYMNDVGLLRKMAGLESNIILEGNKLFEEFKGSFTENYCFNALSSIMDIVPNYYIMDRYEIDFLIQTNNKIIPIEVKSGNSKKHISLTNYNSKFDNDISLIFSLDNLKQDGKVINIPLYLIEYLNNIIK